MLAVSAGFLAALLGFIVTSVQRHDTTVYDWLAVALIYDLFVASWTLGYLSGAS